LPEFEIVRTIDFAHTAAPKEPNDAISIDENHARSESTRRDGVRGDVAGGYRYACRS
jgi:hypothetical protein